MENRLSSATVPGTGGGGANTVSFKYDPFGRRIQKSSASGTTYYLYDGANIVAEVSASGGIVASYAQGSGVDEPLAMRRSGYVNYYHADGLGSVTSLTNTGGSLVATYAYDSFGNTTPTEGIFNPFRYTAREQDPETGLYYYRARYYDPQIGRFLSEDPIDFEGGDNFYTYVENSPINLSDPSGESPWGDAWDWLVSLFDSKSGSKSGSSCPTTCGADGYRDATPEESAKILKMAKSYIGIRYYSGGGGKSSTTNGMDCSGMVYCAINAAGIQYAYAPTASMASSPNLRPLGGTQPRGGDVALFPGHTGFYDPHPSTPGETIVSARSGKGKVAPAPPSYFGKPKYYRVRVKYR